MSKMSQLHAELTEQAARLGFESIEEAEAHGYVVDYESHELVDGQEQAHKDWLEERDATLRALYEVHARAMDESRLADACIIKDTINFIKKGEI